MIQIIIENGINKQMYGEQNTILRKIQIDDHNSKFLKMFRLKKQNRLLQQASFYASQ